MKRAGFVAICCALTAVMLMAISSASAEVPTPEPPSTEYEVPGLMEVEVTGSGWVVAADGTVTYSEQPSPEPETPPALPSPGSTQAALCSANYICVFNNANYGSLQGEITCAFSGNVGLSVAGHSALNRCGNKTNYLRVNGSVIACMNPGGNRPNPGGYNQVYVLAQYGAYS